MSATNESAYEAQKALIDFYNNLPDEYKWKGRDKGPLKREARVEEMEQYLKQYAVPNLRNRKGQLKDDIGDKDVFFYSGDYLGYDLADGNGGYVHIRYILTPYEPHNQGPWNIHSSMLYGWSHHHVDWDITDLVLNINQSSFMNWINENPFDLK